MAGSVTAVRDQLVQEQLKAIKSSVERLESQIAALGADLGSVRLTEMVSMTARMAKLEGDAQLLRYQMGRTTAVWSLVSGGVASAIVAAVMALVLHR